MKESDRDGQNVVAVLVVLTVLELYLGLMFERAALSKKLILLRAVSLGLLFETLRRWAAVCSPNGVEVFLDALCLVKISIVGHLVLQKYRCILVANRCRRLERLEAADGRRDHGQDRNRDRHSDEKRIAQVEGMLGVFCVFEMFGRRFGHDLFLMQAKRTYGRVLFLIRYLAKNRLKWIGKRGRRIAGAPANLEGRQPVYLYRTARPIYKQV